MKGIIAKATHGFFDFGSKTNVSAQEPPGTRRLNGAQLHQFVKASKSGPKNQVAQLYRGIDVDGKNIQPGQLYRRAKANAPGVKEDARKIGEHVHLRPTGVKAHEKDDHQKKAASGFRIASAPTVIFAPIAAALQRWYFDPRDETKLQPFKVTDAVKAKIAQTMLKSPPTKKEAHQRWMATVAEKYGVTKEEVKQWTGDYMDEIVQHVQRGFQPADVAAAYGVEVASVDGMVMRHTAQSALEKRVGGQVIGEQSSIRASAEERRNQTTDVAEQHKIMEDAAKQCEEVVARAAAANKVSKLAVHNWVHTYKQEASRGGRMSPEQLVERGFTTKEAVALARQQMYAEEVVKNRFTPAAVAAAYRVSEQDISAAVEAHGAGIAPRPAHKTPKAA